jgi:hypothetical protein
MQIVLPTKEEITKEYRGLVSAISHRRFKKTQKRLLAKAVGWRMDVDILDRPVRHLNSLRIGNWNSVSNVRIFLV